MSEVPSLLSMEVKPNVNMGGEDLFVRVRGLPFTTTSRELIDFFSGRCMLRSFLAVNLIEPNIACKY